MTTFTNLLFLSELNDLELSDRRVKQLAKAGASVTGSPLSYSQWLQALRDRNLDKLDDAHHISSSKKQTVEFGHPDESMVADELRVTRRATNLALARTLNRSALHGSPVEQLRVGWVTAELTDAGVAALDLQDRSDWKHAQRVAERFLTGVPQWIRDTTGTHASIYGHPGDPLELTLTLPAAPDVTNEQQLLEQAARAADVDLSLLRLVPRDWGSWYEPTESTVGRLALACARLDSRLGSSWTGLDVENGVMLVNYDQRLAVCAALLGDDPMPLFTETMIGPDENGNYSAPAGASPGTDFHGGLLGYVGETRYVPVADVSTAADLCDVMVTFAQHQSG